MSVALEEPAQPAHFFHDSPDPAPVADVDPVFGQVTDPLSKAQGGVVPPVENGTADADAAAEHDNDGPQVVLDASDADKNDASPGNAVAENVEVRSLSTRI